MHICLPRHKSSRVKWITLLLAALFISVLNALKANADAYSPLDKYMVTNIDINNGLPHNFVDHICRDSNGFFWISLGGGGLVRFDGYGFIKYTPSTTPNSIADDFVHNVAEDPFQRLWIATDNGLSILQLATLATVSPTELDSALAKYAALPITSALLDSQGRIWLRHDKGIDCISFDADGKIQCVSAYAFGHISQYNSQILCDIDQDGQVWAEINGKLYKLAPVGADIALSQLDVELPPESIVHDILCYNGIVWIATDRGLVKHAHGKGPDKVYMHEPHNQSSLSQNLVSSLTISPDGNLIAATLNGINIYQPSSDSFLRVKASDMPNKLHSNFVNCMMVCEGSIWVGTETGGINIFSPKSISTSFYAHDANNPASLAANPVNSVFEDKNGVLWVGVVEGGLNRMKLDGSGFDRYTSYNSGLHHNSVSALASDPEGSLWVGTWGGGIDVLDPSNPRVNRLRLLNFGPYGERPYIGALCPDTINNGMWIGTSRGIFFYDLEADEVVAPFDGADSDPRGCIGAVVDNEGHAWIGTMHGLYDIDLNSRIGNRWNYRFMSQKLDAPESDLREKLSYLMLASDGTLWIGSDIHGIYRRCMIDGEEAFENITTDNGLVQNVVHGIAEDASHRIWIATNRGLSCYSTQEKRFVNYSQSEGLPSDQFYWNAASSSRSGRLYFGTVNGLLAIDPPHSKTDNAPARVVFTRLIVDNEPASWDSGFSTADISMADGIRLHERNKSFSIEFSALDFTHNPSCHYYYKLEGFDKQWIQLPQGRNFVTYTNLHPGKYKLLVSYHPDGANSDSAMAALDITVQRYFYHTIWFYILVAILLAAAVAAFVLWRMRRTLAKKRELEEAVEMRTREISKQKQMLEERTMRIQELTVERLSFFTNLTHEFRTPITLIMGPVRRALQLCKDKNVSDQLNYVERNAQYLLNLVNQLMDFRKIESGKMDIMRKRSDFTAFLDEIVDSFRTVASERGIELEKYVHIPRPEICYDKEAVRKLLINLLSNAVKYTPDNGTITVCAALLPQQCTQSVSEHLYICVSDTGDGIAPDDIDKVFDRFYQGKSYMKYPTMQASSGIGLHLCKCIVEAYGGRISVKNNPQRGCRFRIVIPVPAYADEEPAAIQPAASETATAGQAQNRRMSIMVIEDNDDMRGYIKTVLADKYDVKEACNGEDALAKLVDNDVDFIICDLMMPVMDGMEFAKKAKENFATSHIPILMLTARTSDEAKLESFRQGVDEYLTKPFSEEMLLTRIDNILANKQRHQRKFAMAYDVAELDVEESRDKKFLDQVMAVLKENYKNSYFDMGDFAEALGVSRSVLNKKLQSLVGQTSNEFVRNYRLNIARQMILLNRQTRSMNISEIAYDVGFNDSKYFTRCFSKHFGITPSALLASEGEI